MQVYHPINNYTESLRFTYCFIHNLTLIISFIIMIFRNDSYCQVSASDQNQSVTGNWQLYPYTYPEKPEISSPFTFEDGTETVVVMTKDDKYGIIPVTVENGKPLLYSRKIEQLIGKDQQLEVAAGDFPALAATGLHDEASLLLKEWITGLPVDIITTIARPLAYSHVGFIAEDENIISVLIGDNRLVKAMGLTHPQMAKPIFHIWNILLQEMEYGYWVRFYDHIKYIHYNGNIISFQAHGTKGWQLSIFQDEIQGSCDISVWREITSGEKEYLDNNYPGLTDSQRTELESRISVLHFSEMNPYYIMRYGFYEGHTYYRCDPIAIAFIFGMKSLEDLDRSLDNDLYQALTGHFTTE